jgi:hypothetical protein
MRGLLTWDWWVAGGSSWGVGQLGLAMHPRIPSRAESGGKGKHENPQCFLIIDSLP